VAGVARAAAGDLEILAELSLEDPVITLDLLLLTEADRILARLAPAILVHPRHAFAAVDGALGGIAPRPLQEQLQAFGTAKATGRSNMSSRGSAGTPVKPRCGLVGPSCPAPHVEGPPVPRETVQK